ncbi:MAG: tRNA pseudouridine(55) synthase TruB [Bacteroidales bacterium]|nr:tRNA pseudouridine(55) synthase TruB [Bacteroidales bacterium]
MQGFTKHTNFQEGVVLYIDKPLEWSSFDVVHKMRNLIRKHFSLKWIKVGHAGTLDPLATGLMIICTGAKTKNIHYYLDHDKEYLATICLGKTTPSFDLETEVDHAYPTDHITEDLIKKILQKFIGIQDQIPPVFSAKWISGKRAYELARKGEKVEMKPKEIRIDSIDMITYKPPHLTLQIKCSKGTYIRALAMDIGKSLESGGHLVELRRTAIGDISVDQAWSITKFEGNLKKL